MFNGRFKDFPSAYSSWFGTSVVLLLGIRQVPVPCSIIHESVADVRVRFNPGWEMDVRKELILAVEEDPGSRINQYGPVRAPDIGEVHMTIEQVSFGVVVPGASAMNALAAIRFLFSEQ